MKLQSLFLAFCALSLSACDKSVELKNGQLPAELVPYAQTLAGTYEGHFNGVPNTLNVVLEDDHLSLVPGADLIGSTCASSIGNATRVDVSERNKDVVGISNVTFSFDPGACVSTAEGRRLEVQVAAAHDDQARINVRLLLGYHMEWRYEPGRQVCGVDRFTRVVCWQTPGRYIQWREADYAFGSFVKH